MNTKSRDVTPYRGYVIRQNYLNAMIWIEKEGAHIAWAPSIDEAKKTIDQLLN